MTWWSDWHCCGQNILHVTQMGCKTINFDRFRGNTANKGFCRVRIDLQNAVVILVLRFATLQNKLATAVWGSSPSPPPEHVSLEKS
jgi:hypothetical protein